MRFSTPSRSLGDCVGALFAWGRGFATSMFGSSRAADDPILTVFSKSLTLRSYAGINPYSTAPRARGPREISTCS